MQTIDLLFFKSKRCTFCSAQQGSITLLENQYPDQVKVTTIDVTKDPEMAEKWLVDKTPTMILVFPSTGAEIERKTGLINRAELFDWVLKYIS